MNSSSDLLVKLLILWTHIIHIKESFSKVYSIDAENLRQAVLYNMPKLFTLNINRIIVNII
jgi:hypothetical protein